MTVGDAPRPRIQVVAQLLDASLQRRGELLGGPVRMLLGHRVDESAQAGGRVRRRVGSDRGEEPPQWACQRAFELRRRQDDLPTVVLCARRRAARAQPTLRLRGRNTLAGHERQQRGRKLGVDRVIRRSRACPQVGDVPGQGQRRVDLINGHHVVVTRRARQARHHIEKHRGGRILRAHGTGVHDAARTRQGSDKEAVLVIQDHAPSGARRVNQFLAPVLAHHRAARTHVREEVSAKDPVAQPQIRPCPVLQAGEDDDLPAAAHRLRGGQDLDAGGAHADARNRVDGDRT